MRLKALAEIYTMHSFAQLCNLNFLSKNVKCFARFCKIQQHFWHNFDRKFEIAELCKGVHCVDLGESFQTHIFLQNLASLQPRTSPLKSVGRGATGRGCASWTSPAEETARGNQAAAACSLLQHFWRVSRQLLVKFFQISEKYFIDFEFAIFFKAARFLTAI